MGGVGSWTAEALVRTGIGKLTLVDYDDICMSNTNRQLHALDGQVGKLKVEVLKERFLKINPELQIEIIADIMGIETVEKYLELKPDVLVDCIDRMRAKLIMIATARRLGIAVVTVGGAGGRRDATKVLVTDLAQTTGDSLLSYVRKKLRQEYGFSRKLSTKFGVPCVYSHEAQFYPQTDGCAIQNPDLVPDTTKNLDCSTGFGSSSFVTGTFGLLAGQCAIDLFLAKPAQESSI